MSKEENHWIISGLTVHTEQGPLPNAALQVQDKKIAGIFTKTTKNFSGRLLEFPPNYHLVPGRIDMHIHGARGADVMDATPEALDLICQALAEEGVTGFLPTTITESVEKIDRALQNLRSYQDNLETRPSGSAILGIHLEGPFISTRHAGAHRTELILNPDINLFNRWQALANGAVKSVTIAPELPGGLEFIRYLTNQGVIASLGHTDADFGVAQAAIEAGACHATHLFNAMRGFHHREPGCVGAILIDPRVLGELVLDGHHLHSGTVQLAWKAKGADGLVLVTDAMRAKCCGAGGHFDLGGKTVTVQQGAARLADGTLAGSVLTMTQAVKNLLQFTGCSLTEVINLTSVNPAKALKIYGRTGSIATGKDADLVVLDENLAVVLTLAKGEIIYSGGRQC